MTAEEQKTYDEIMAKGRSVADAVKQHRLREGNQRQRHRWPGRR